LQTEVFGKRNGTEDSRLRAGMLI